VTIPVAESLHKYKPVSITEKIFLIKKQIK